MLTVKMSLSWLMLLVAIPALTAADAELERFQGKWEVVELAEDGKVIPSHAIEDMLPSGGRLEIVDDAIITVSPETGKKEVKLFSIEAAEYPKGIEIRTRDKREVWGIYRFDADRLVVCLVDHEDGSRPETFSARAGSKRMLLTLRPVGRKLTADARRPEAKEPPESEPAAPDAGSARLLSDEDTTKLLRGTVWKYKDSQGALVLSLQADGRFSTVREATEMRLFQKVFVQAPISSGSWRIQKGKLWLHINTSVDPSRVDATVPFTLRVVTDKDLIFVDYVGHVGQAVRVR